MDSNMIEERAEASAARVKPLLRGIHHLALNTSDMRMTLRVAKSEASSRHLFCRCCCPGVS